MSLENKLYGHIVNWEKYREKYFRMPEKEVIPDRIYEKHPDYIPVYNEEHGRLVPNQNDTEFWECYDESNEADKLFLLDGFTDSLKKGLYFPNITSSPLWFHKMLWDQCFEDIPESPSEPLKSDSQIINELIDRMEYDEEEENSEWAEKFRRGEPVRVGPWSKDPEYLASLKKEKEERERREKEEKND